MLDRTEHAYGVKSEVFCSAYFMASISASGFPVQNHKDNPVYLCHHSILSQHLVNEEQSGLHDKNFQALRPKTQPEFIFLNIRNAGIIQSIAKPSYNYLEHLFKQYYIKIASFFSFFLSVSVVSKPLLKFKPGC